MTREQLKAEMVKVMHYHFGWDADQRTDSEMMVEFIDQLIRLNIKELKQEGH